MLRKVGKPLGVLLFVKYVGQAMALRGEAVKICNDYHLSMLKFEDRLRGVEDLLNGYRNWLQDYEDRNCDDEDPAPDDEYRDEGYTDSKRSTTPEDKFGPAGSDAPETPAGGEQRFVPAGQTMHYRVDFWNKPDAEVPTQDAIILDRLDPAVFDLSTLQITRVGFLAWDVPLSSGPLVETRIDCRPEMNIAVEITAGLGLKIPGFANNDDIDEDTLVFWFHTVDPETGQWPTDPFAGFLPPFDPETGFEIGWIEFTVDPVAGLPSGTQLSNVAYVEFDFAGDIYDHPAPKVDPDIEPAEPAPWTNTIDAGRPTSRVETLPPTTLSEILTVRWSGEDDVSGSGIASFDVYVSINGGSYELWLDDTTDTMALWETKHGDTYAFYSVATDYVLHRETVPAEADAVTTVTDALWQNPRNRFDVNGVDGTTAVDALILINYLNAHAGDPLLPDAPKLPPPYYDVNGNGYCTAEDLLAVITELNRQASSQGEGEYADRGRSPRPDLAVAGNVSWSSNPLVSLPDGSVGWLLACPGLRRPHGTAAQRATGKSAGSRWPAVGLRPYPAPRVMPVFAPCEDWESILDEVSSDTAIVCSVKRSYL